MMIRNPQETLYSAVPTQPPEESGGSMTNQNFLSPQELRRRLGMAKVIELMGGMEHAGVCAVEKSSVYGAALAMPQIARSAGYPKSMMCLAFRAYLFVVINYFCQTAFVYYIYDSQTNMNPFGGQMHLCDFAAHLSSCPDAPGCQGPGGETIADPGALYPFDIWLTRRLVRDSLLFLFPDRKDDINSNIDPGEYGLESYYCRLLCIFIFVLQIADEFQNINDLLRFLWRIPTDNGPWIEYDPPVKDTHHPSELEFVSFKVNGMPLKWKIINILVLLLPRIFIWRMLTMAGVHFLMETAAMVDQIVNTTALSFVLTVDEMILERLATTATKTIVSNLKGYSLYDDRLQDASDQETLERYYVQELSWCHSGHTFPLLPKRLFWTVAIMAVFMVEYYWHNCIRIEDGSIISKDVYLPINAHLDFFVFVQKFFSLSGELHVDTAFWSREMMA